MRGKGSLLFFMMCMMVLSLNYYYHNHTGRNSSGDIVSWAREKERFIDGKERKDFIRYNVLRNLNMKKDVTEKDDDEALLEQLSTLFLRVYR